MNCKTLPISSGSKSTVYPKIENPTQYESSREEYSNLDSFIKDQYSGEVISLDNSFRINRYEVKRAYWDKRPKDMLPKYANRNMACTLMVMFAHVGLSLLLGTPPLQILQAPMHPITRVLGGLATSYCYPKLILEPWLHPKRVEEFERNNQVIVQSKEFVENNWYRKPKPLD